MLFLRCLVAIFVAAAAVDVVVKNIVPPLPFVCAILVIDDISVFCVEISGTVCILFVRRLHLFSIFCVCVWDHY